MRITAGSHVLFGQLVTRGAAADVLAAWLAAQVGGDELEIRDRAWWLECIADARDSELTLFEEARTNYARVEMLRSLVDAVAGSARSGEVSLQHDDNGVHVSTWRIVDGVVTAAVAEHQAFVAPRVSAAIRRTFTAKRAAHDQRYARLGVGEELREFIAETKHARAVCLRGGSLELRQRFAATIHQAHGTSTPLAFVANVTALSVEEQGALLAAIRDQEGAHLFVGMPADPHAAVGAGTLRVDLFYWLSAQPGWPLDREVEAIEAALGRLQSS